MSTCNCIYYTDMYMYKQFRFGQEGTLEYKVMNPTQTGILHFTMFWLQFCRLKLTTDNLIDLGKDSTVAKGHACW